MPPAKRRRMDFGDEIDCDGEGCGNPECISCQEEGMRELVEEDGNHIHQPHPVQQQQRQQPPQQLPPMALPSFQTMVAQLDEASVRNTLMWLVCFSQAAQNAVVGVYTRDFQRVPQPQHQAQPYAQPQFQIRLDFKPIRAINFDNYSREVWHVLNTSHYTKLRSSKQYEAAGDAWREIEESIKSIDRQTCPESPFATKQSALETLRKITKTLLLAPMDDLGHEIRQMLQYEDIIPTIMLKILQTMDREERINAGKHADEKGSLLDKVQWCVNEAEGYCLDGLDGLKTVVTMLDGNDDGDYEDGDTGSGDDHDEDGVGPEVIQV